MIDITFGSVHLKQEGSDVYVLTMRGGENVFNDNSVKDINDALDEMEKTTGACALIITAEGKFFSTGLDLKWLGTKTSSAFVDFLRKFQRLLARILVLPYPTIAAINGHCIAGGAMLSLACDWRVMREDRGFWSLPEVDINMPLTAGMTAIISAKIKSPLTYRDAVLLAKKYGGAVAKTEKIVDFSASEDKVLQVAIEFAQKIAAKGTNRSVFGAIKRERFKSTTIRLCQDSLGETDKIVLTVPKL